MYNRKDWLGLATCTLWFYRTIIIVVIKIIITMLMIPSWLDRWKKKVLFQTSNKELSPWIWLQVNFFKWLLGGDFIKQKNSTFSFKPKNSKFWAYTFNLINSGLSSIYYHKLQSSMCCKLSINAFKFLLLALFNHSEDQ